VIYSTPGAIRKALSVEKYTHLNFLSREGEIERESCDPVQSNQRAFFDQSRGLQRVAVVLAASNWAGK
jgi:hypothetical protein